LGFERWPDPPVRRAVAPRTRPTGRDHHKNTVAIWWDKGGGPASAAGKWKTGSGRAPRDSSQEQGPDRENGEAGPVQALEGRAPGRDGGGGDPADGPKKGASPGLAARFPDGGGPLAKPGGDRGFRVVHRSPPPAGAAEFAPGGPVNARARRRRGPQSRTGPPIRKKRAVGPEPWKSRRPRNPRQGARPNRGRRRR